MDRQIWTTPNYMAINSSGVAYRASQRTSPAGFNHNAAPMIQDAITDLQIAYQQTPTEQLYVERAALRQGLVLAAGTERQAGGQHPDMTRAQLIDRELQRRGGTWAEPEVQRRIGWPAPSDKIEPIRQATITGVYGASEPPPPSPPIRRSEVEEVVAIAAQHEASQAQSDAIIGAVLGAAASHLANKGVFIGAILGAVAGYYLSPRLR